MATTPATQPRPTSTPAEVLVVDDNPADLRLTREALAQGRIAKLVHTAPDGERALAFLRREDPFCEAPRPDLIILDLNMPRLDGCQVLQNIRATPVLREIPVIILTNSDSEEDRTRAYSHHASSYIRKPSAFADLVQHILAEESRWLGHLATRPPTD